MRKGFFNAKPRSEAPRPASASAASPAAAPAAPAPEVDEPPVELSTLGEIEDGKDYILQLPDELLTSLLARLDFQSRTTIRAVCKRMFNLVMEAGVWAVIASTNKRSWRAALFGGPDDGPSELLTHAESSVNALLARRFHMLCHGGRILQARAEPARNRWGSRLRRLEVMESIEAHMEASQEGRAPPQSTPMGVRSATAAILLHALARRRAPLRALALECRVTKECRAHFAAHPSVADAVAGLAPGLRNLQVGDGNVGGPVAARLFGTAEARATGFPALRGLALSINCRPPSTILEGILARCGNLRRLALDARASYTRQAEGAEAEALLSGAGAAGLLRGLPGLESLALAAPRPVDAEALSALLGGAAVLLGDGTSAPAGCSPPRGPRWLCLRWETADGRLPPAKTPAPEVSVRGCPRLRGLALVEWTNTGFRGPRPWGASTVMRRGARMRIMNPRVFYAGRRPRAPDRRRPLPSFPTLFPPPAYRKGSEERVQAHRAGSGAPGDRDPSDDLSDGDSEVEDCLEEDEVFELEYMREGWDIYLPPPHVRPDVRDCPNLRGFYTFSVVHVPPECLKSFAPGLSISRLCPTDAALDDLFSSNMRHLHITIPGYGLKANQLRWLAACTGLETLCLRVNPDGGDARLALTLPSVRSLRLFCDEVPFAVASGLRLAGKPFAVLEVEAPRMEELVLGPWGALGPLRFSAPRLKSARLLYSARLLTEAFLEGFLRACPALEELELVGGLPSKDDRLTSLRIVAPRLRSLTCLRLNEVSSVSIAAPLLREATFGHMDPMDSDLIAALVANRGPGGTPPRLQRLTVAELPRLRSMDLTAFPYLEAVEAEGCDYLSAMRARSSRLRSMRAVACARMSEDRLSAGPLAPRWCAGYVEQEGKLGEVFFWDGSRFAPNEVERRRPPGAAADDEGGSDDEDDEEDAEEDEDEEEADEGEISQASDDISEGEGGR
eukprot:tig00000615_g2600.t1